MRDLLAACKDGGARDAQGPFDEEYSDRLL